VSGGTELEGAVQWDVAGCDVYCRVVGVPEARIWYGQKGAEGGGAGRGFINASKAVCFVMIIAGSHHTAWKLHVVSSCANAA
jgi:hypothetical protein